MDNFLIPAALVLALTTILFAADSVYWWRKNQASEQTILELTFKVNTARQQGCAEGWSGGMRYQRGVLFTAAIKAGADDRILAALREAGKGPIEEKPIVQVPEIV